MTDSETNTNIFYRTDESVPDDTETIQSHDNDKKISVSESLFSESTPYSELFGKNNDFDNGFGEYDTKLVQNLKTNFAHTSLGQNNIFSASNDYHSIKYNIPLSWDMVDTDQIKNKLLDMQRDMIDTEYLPHNASVSHSLKKNSPPNKHDQDKYSTSSYSETSVNDSNTQPVKHNSSPSLEERMHELVSANSALTGGKLKEVVLSSTSTHNTSSMFPISVSTTETGVQLPINYSESVSPDSHKSSSKTPSYILVSDNRKEKKTKKKRTHKRKKRKRKEKIHLIA